MNKCEWREEGRYTSMPIKIMRTMRERYGVRFIICSKKDMGKKIFELLGGKNG